MAAEHLHFDIINGATKTNRDGYAIAEKTEDPGSILGPGHP